MLSGICFEITKVGAGRGYRVRGYHKVKTAKLGWQVPGVLRQLCLPDCLLTICITKSKNKILSHKASERNILLEFQTRLCSILSAEADPGCLQGGLAALHIQAI